jgi:sugar phosphate isomerase/epimerase
MSELLRRDFLRCSLGVGAAALATGPWDKALAFGADKPGSKMRFGLVTYEWAKDWDLATLIANLEKSRVPGVELRTTHAHRVERDLSAQERKDVKRRFDDSGVTLVGLGSNERFDSPEPDALKKAIEATKKFIKLSHDVGGSGVKVKPNDLYKEIPIEKTIDQIGRSLNIVGRFGADYGQQIRLEVHGQCRWLPIMKRIMDVADHPNVAVCWNSNASDLEGEGLEHNFNLVKDRFGATCHVRPLDSKDYPYPKLLELFVKMNYAGWVMLECGGKGPKDTVKVLAEQGRLFKKMVAIAQAGL